jgi:hypothetical protein
MPDASPILTLDYIAHPISGDIIGNITAVLAIARQIHLTEPGVAPLLPYITTLMYFDDTRSRDRQMGIDVNNEFISRSADRLRIHGMKLSYGVRHETLKFKSLARPIILQNPALEHELEELLEGYPFAVVPFTPEPRYYQEVEEHLSSMLSPASWLQRSL